MKTLERDSDTKPWKDKEDSPFIDDLGIWEIKVSILKDRTGLSDIKENGKIYIEDQLPKELDFNIEDQKDPKNFSGVYNKEKHTIRWEFDAPSEKDQEGTVIDGNLFEKEVELRLIFNDQIESPIVTNKANFKYENITSTKDNKSFTEVSATGQVELESGMVPMGLFGKDIEITKIEGSGTYDIVTSGNLPNITPAPIYLPGAVFELRRASDNALINTVTTGSNGRVTISNVSGGVIGIKYYLIEITPPAGYQSNAPEIEITIPPIIYTSDVVRVRVHNTKIVTNGSLEITKVDGEDTATKLSGAEFELQNSTGTNVIQTGTTNAQGKYTFNNLPVGSYKLVETKAPEGYRILTEPITINITAGNKTEKTVENSLLGWELPATGGIGSTIFYTSGLMLMLLAGMTGIKKRNKDTNK